jgi:HK97 family phage prohead protease
VVKDDDNELEGCHMTEDQAKDQQAALYANEDGGRAERPPRDNIVRSVMPGVELRADEERPTLFGHFAVFDQWAEIDSAFEGHFMERIAPGAFAKSFAENRSRIRVLFEHGQDPQIGNKPLGPIADLREDKVGAYYEVPLSDTSYNRDITQLLRDGLLGASFRFSVIKEDFKRNTSASPYNPEALPERTVQEVDLAEFGPVTFPAYAGASAGVRSDTDDYIRRLLVPEFDEIRETLAALRQQALPGDGAEATHSDEGSSAIAAIPRFRTSQEFRQWLRSSAN